MILASLTAERAAVRAATRAAALIKGVSEETPPAHWFYQMMEAGTLLLPAINVNDR